MSPDSIIVNINTFLYLLVCVGRHCGRLPALCILVFIKLWIRWSHDFVVSLVLLRIMCISNITVSVNMMIQHSAEKPTLTKSVYCDCLVRVTITDTFPAISFGLF